MFDNLEPIVRDAVMKILTAIYETGFVDEVNLRVVYDLFGVGANELEGPPDNILSFKSKFWAEAYIRHTQEISDDDDLTVIHVEAGEPIPEEIRAKLESIGVDVDKMESGAMFGEFSEREELPEGASSGDLDPDRIIH